MNKVFNVFLVVCVGVIGYLFFESTPQSSNAYALSNSWASKFGDPVIPVQEEKKNKLSNKKVLTAEEVVRILENAGFENDIPVMVAVAWRESRFRVSAYNGDAGTGDSSHGLFQINMIGNLAEPRAEWFNISRSNSGKFEQLFNPHKNAKSAFRIYTARINYDGHSQRMRDWKVTSQAQADNVIRQAMNESEDYRELFGNVKYKF
jgi:hypothetical protein